MATVSENEKIESATTPRRSRRRKTSHLKSVPDTREMRELLKAKLASVAARMDKRHTFSKDQMESITRKALEEMDQPESYLGWAMVVLATEFWRDQIASIPPSRRLFLLPHCLKHAEGCPADYDEFGLDCKTCGACSIADYRGIAEEMGYKVLVAEGSPIVLKIIMSGHVDAVVGVACLNVLEKAIDKILLAGIPCMAVPLLSSDCRNTSVDEDWVNDMIRVSQQEGVERTASFMHLMRGAEQLFSKDELDRIVPRSRSNQNLASLNGSAMNELDPISATETIAYDFLSKGGKHSRPFITLAAYDAMTGGSATTPEGGEVVAGWSDAIKKTAMSIETFHKASLVHDDIEDGDAFRYGQPAVHQTFGVPTAINVGDYLIGLGYRMVSRESKGLGPDVVADILDSLADAHQRLSEGQGAELLWRDSDNKSLKPIDALQIYALKTSPAFEAALYSGVRLAGPVGDLAETIKIYSRHMGVGFQILNDLKDWQVDQDNKMNSGGDVLGGRPTLLWALALDALDEPQRAELIALSSNESLSTDARIAQVRSFYEQANVFEKATRLVEKYRERAQAVAEETPVEELRRLLFFLIDTVLERPEELNASVSQNGESLLSIEGSNNGSSDRKAK